MAARLGLSALIKFCRTNGIVVAETLEEAVQLDQGCYTSSRSDEVRVETADRLKDNEIAALDEFKNTAGTNQWWSTCVWERIWS